MKRRFDLLARFVAAACAAGGYAHAAEPPAQPPAALPTPDAGALPPPSAAPGEQVVPAAAPNPNSGCDDDPLHPNRRRPGHTGKDYGEVNCDPNRLPRPDTSPLKSPAAKDRWRIIDAIGYPDNYLNPYATNNQLKGDRPLLDRSLVDG